MATPEVERVFGKAGRAETSTDPAPFSMMETTIILKPESEWRPVKRWYSSLPQFIQKPLSHIWHNRITWDEFVNELDQKMQFPGVSNAWTMPIKARIDMLTTGVRTPIGIKVYEADLKEIEKIGTSLEMILRDVKGTRMWSGQYENMLRVKKRLKVVIPLTIFIIFVLLYMNTKSPVKAGIVMLAVPFSLVGAVWFLFILKFNVSIAVWVGMIALMGLDAETGVFMLLFLDLSPSQTFGSQPSAYSRRHMAMAFSSPRMCPFCLSRWSVRSSFQAILERWSMVMLTLASSIGARSFSPVRIPLRRFWKCCVVIASMLWRSCVVVVFCVLNSWINLSSRLKTWYPSRSTSTVPSVPCMVEPRLRP